ncbi:MAG: hypothetical protein WDN69_37895 [Aliidongia sp.]
MHEDAAQGGADALLKLGAHCTVVIGKGRTPVGVKLEFHCQSRPVRPRAQRFEVIAGLGESERYITVFDGGIGNCRGQIFEFRDDADQVIAHHFQQQRLFARKIGVNGALGIAGRFRDVADRGGRDAEIYDLLACASISLLRVASWLSPRDSRDRIRFIRSRRNLRLLALVLHSRLRR